MIYLGVLKRVIPFFLTFAAGLFIASFFVSIAAPNMNFRSGRVSNKYREIQRLRTENEELRERNRCLERKLEESRRNSYGWSKSELELAVPPVIPAAPEPPAPSRAPRYGR